MPYQIEICNQGVKVFYTGTVTLETIEECDRQIVTDSAFFDVSYVIYNFLGSDEQTISVSDAYLLGLRSSEKASRNSRLKLAVVSESPEVLVLAESFKKVAELSNCSWQVRTFSSMRDAEVWCDAISDVLISHG
jgi:hypothetical protein